MSNCPCGSGKEYDDCCGPIIKGTAPAPTAEALMRSRYSAYVVCELDHLKNSMLPELREDFDPEGVETWARTADWQGLDIIETVDGLEGDDTGEVEFAARFTQQGLPQEHRERALFKRTDTGWLYADGLVRRPEPVRRQTPKVGRNDPCPCGSGKKFKKCCGK